jgi:hypothetical protein
MKISLNNIHHSTGKPSGEGLVLAGLICIAIIGMAILAGIAVPMILHKIKEGACAEACGNMRSVGCALLSFEADYGRFPCDATAPEVKDNNPDTPCILILGKTSANDYFRQLIAAGCMDTEIPFYARIAGCRKPDKRMDGTHSLEKGECGFSYIIGPDADREPPQPLLVTPLIPGTDCFDPQPFGRKAVIVWTDSKTTVLPIDQDGHVVHLGTNLLDPANPVWHGKPPRIVWPE